MRPRACTVPLGNNDVYPSYHVNTSAAMPYAAHAAVARQYCGLDDATAELFAATGYYSIEVRGALRVIILNTNVYSYRNAAIVHEDDPLDQFAWLDVQLRDAAERGLKVQLHGHIPPAIDMWAKTLQWQPQYADKYWALMTAHAPTVVGHFFGHTHSSEVRFDPSGAAAALPALQILAAVSPIYDNNPVFYSARLSNVTLRIEALTSHVLDLARVQNFPSFVARPHAAPPAEEGEAREGSSSEGRLSLSSASYHRWISTWHTEAGDESFYAFLRQFKAFMQPTRGKHCTSAATYAFAECETCTEGCRAAFACLQSHGVNETLYQACVAERIQSVER